MSNTNNTNVNNNGATEEQTMAVQEILAAKTLYDIFGTDRSTAPLRKQYLMASVKVHPDKNPHPQATESFQRVAEAWGTLSDASNRSAYDRELRNTTSNNNQNSSNNNGGGAQHYAADFERSHMPSFGDALFMFATATAMFSSMGGGGGNTGATTSTGAAGAAGVGAAAASRTSSTTNAASDLLETLFWAQKLAGGRSDDDDQQQQQQHGSRSGVGGDYDNTYNGSSNNNRDTTKGPPSAAETAAKHPMTSGMALGSGLRAVAGAQRMMGMRKSAEAMEKAATTVQVAAMGATVLKAASENPAVQRTMERGQSTMKNNPQIGRGLRASLKMAGSVILTLAQAQHEAQQQQQQEQGNNNSGTNNRQSGAR